MDAINEQLENITIQQSVLIGIVLAVFYYALLFDDGSILDRQITEAMDSIERDKVTLSKVEKALEDKKRFESEIRETTNYMKIYQEYFPITFSGNVLESKVTEFSKKYNLTIVSLKQLPSESEFKNYPETMLQVEVEGEYHKIMSFISDITKIKKAMVFKKMKFTVAKPSFLPKFRFQFILPFKGITNGLEGLEIG